MAQSNQPQEYRQMRFQAPAGATEILLVRHGESRPATADAPFPLVDGHGDPELHSNGHDQAQRVGERLRALPVRAIYVTNLRRTVETATPLARHLGLTPMVEPDLREVFLGEWEGGVLRMKAHQQDPVFVRMQAEQRWDVIPGGESHAAINMRVMRALNSIAARHVNELVVAVVHGGVIGHIIAHATGAQPFAFNGCDNGSVSHIVMMEGRIQVRSFNDTAHLSARPTATGAQMT